MRLMFGCTAIVVAGLVVSTVFAQVQNYPNRPIRLIAPFPPGGTNDVLSRIIAQKMTQHWGQTVLVLNRPGAFGIIGTELAAKSAPDGYTLVNVVSSHVMHKFLFKKVPFDAIKDFDPIILLARATNVLIVHRSVPVDNIRDFVSFARTRKGQLGYGTAGTGTSNHLSAEMFKQAAGIEMEHIPYKGGAAAVNDLLGGQIPVMMASLLTASPHVLSHRIRALGVTSAQRQRVLPEVPTLQESGFPGFEANEWWAILAPAGTPKDIAGKLNTEITRIFDLPDVKQLTDNLGIEYIGSTPDGLDKFLRDESSKWERIIKNAGLKPEG